MTCDKFDESIQFLEIIFIPQSRFAFLHGQSILALKITTRVAAHKAGARHPSGARPADGPPVDLMAMPTAALPQAFSISYLKRGTIYHGDKISSLFQTVEEI
ncbi:hypothetical protein LJB99_02465 [Deltaproteobacteria bacterium OttesenSCG-928-K17]|nr:hypothetical protein [Deltaproteobacteria bacterium OttesenSCG-928-K17]